MGASGGPARWVSLCPSVPVPRLVLLALFVLFAPTAAAQIGIGAQLGSPTGVSLALGRGSGGIRVAAGLAPGDAVSAEGHYLFRVRPLEGTDARARWFYGPGAYVRVADDDEDQIAASGILGMEVEAADDFDVFGAITARLFFTGDTELDFGGGIGVRFWL